VARASSRRPHARRSRSGARSACATSPRSAKSTFKGPMPPPSSIASTSTTSPRSPWDGRVMA
jgi:hypothetical protein